MNWSVLITFACGVGAYLIFLGLFTLYKYFRNKKRVKKEIQEDEKEKEQQSQDNSNKK